MRRKIGNSFPSLEELQKKFGEIPGVQSHDPKERKKRFLVGLLEHMLNVLERK